MQVGTHPVTCSPRAKITLLGYVDASVGQQHVWERRATSFRDTTSTLGKKKPNDAFEVKLLKKWFSYKAAFRGCLHASCSVSSHNLSLVYVHATPHTHQWQFQGTMRLCLRHAWLASIEMHQIRQANYFSRLCSLQTKLTPCFGPWCLFKYLRHLLIWGKENFIQQHNVGTDWVENVSNMFPPPPIRRLSLQYS